MRISSSKDDDTEGTCSPSDAREIATRVLLKAVSAPAWAVRLSSSSAISTLYWRLGIVDDLARRRRGQDQRVFGWRDRGQPVGERTEPALIGVAPGGVEHDELGLGALFLHRLEQGFDADAVAADIGFLPDRGIDRDHKTLAADLDAVAAEEQHHHAVGLDLGLQPADGAGHVVLGGVFDHVDVKALAAQGSGQAAGVVDRLGERRRSVGVMAIADHQCNAGSFCRGVRILFGRDCLGGIERTLVERGMGADRQRHQADQRGGHGDRASGYAKLTYFHNLQIPIVDQGTVQTRAPVSRASAV